MGWLCPSRPIYPHRAGKSCFTNVRISPLSPALQTKDLRILMETNISRIALYARVSKKDGQDPANQLAQLREFA